MCSGMRKKGKENQDLTMFPKIPTDTGGGGQLRLYHVQIWTAPLTERMLNEDWLPRVPVVFLAVGDVAAIVAQAVGVWLDVRGPGGAMLCVSREEDEEVGEEEHEQHGESLYRCERG